MKWYFALNESSIRVDQMYADCIRAAVHSARSNTSLEPCLIFDGKPCDFTDSLQRAGVKIIYHRTSFYTAMMAKTEDPGWRQIATGAYLRLDIPLLELHEPVVLYTDCDVMFQREFDSGRYVPRFFAVAPEFDLGEYDTFNSGAMLINIDAMRQSYIDFARFIRARDFEFDAWDQGALRAYYGDRFDPLPPSMNWKPYWGPNPEASIIHFHGPKPPHVMAIQADRAAHNQPPVYADLVDRDPEFYREMVSLWSNNIADFRSLYG